MTKPQTMKHRAQLVAGRAQAQAEMVPLPAVRDLVADLCGLVVDLADRIDQLEARDRGE